jgi:putative sigma-54 modulation protein
MQVAVSFRHMDVSPTVQSYASDKLTHVMEKYVAGMDTDAQATFSTERFLHVANFTIVVNGMTVKCVEKSEDMYSSIDLAIDKIDRQLRRFKTRLRNHRPDQRKRNFTMEVLPAPTHDADEETSDVLANGALPETPPASTEPPSAAPLRREVRTAPFLTVDQAILQLELLGDTFFLFTHPETESLQIVYRRNDGHYGLISPEAATH